MDETVRRRGFLLGTLITTLRKPMGALGLALVALLTLAAIFAPFIAPYDPIAQLVGERLQSPSARHLMGTDQFGRDIFSRVLFGGRLSLGIGIAAVSSGAVIGTMLGLVSGYFGGLADTIVMRCSDVLLAYPGILLGVIVVAVMGPGVTKVAVAVAIVNVPIFARLVRASVLRERELEYVLAVECLGGSDARIIFRHVFPNSLGPILVQLSISMALAVLLEAALSFLGLGAQPPAPSWGSMLNESRPFMRQVPLFSIFPGLALASLMIGLSFFADALRETLDPHAKSRSG